MSQKVSITKVSVTGISPFIGLFDVADAQGNMFKIPRWSRNADDLMKWLSDGYRYRFNQLRSRRSKWTYKETSEGIESKELVPIGETTDERSEKETRLEESFIASIPAHILGHPNQTEMKEWFAAIKQRKTLQAKGAKPGAMPRFRKRSREDIKFGCWHNKGNNAIFHKTGRSTGVVVIKGQNLKKNLHPNENGYRFAIRLHVRVSEPIREYTSVEVNWTTKTLVFVNPPKNLETSKLTGAAVGLDAGVIHAFSSSDNETFDLPVQKIRELENRIKFYQKRMAKSRELARKEHRNFWESKRYQSNKAAATTLYKKITNIRNDSWHKITTDLIRSYDYIFIEDLNIKNMMKSASGTIEKPGTNVSQKRGLNRALKRLALGIAQKQLAYKAALNGKICMSVKSQYSSQECSTCGYVDKENRKSQAVFSCLQCSHSENADINAAKVILKRGVEGLNSRGG